MKIFLIHTVFLLLLSCNSRTSTERDPIFEKSYKQQKDEGLIEEFPIHIDSVKNIYSNYKYQFSFNGPDNFEFDEGINDHTIYRTFNRDSGITITINVIEVPKVDENEDLNFWDLYLSNKSLMDAQITELYEKFYNTPVEDYRASKSYVRNQVALKRTFRGKMIQEDFTYYIQTIMYQFRFEEFVYTVGLDVPDVYYNINQDYYNRFISNFQFTASLRTSRPK